MPARRRPAPPAPPLKGGLLLHTPLGAVLGERRVRLLEAIAQHGSLNRAARAVPLSYKAAWDALHAMDQLAPQPLVERSTGGSGGGGTTLTPYARQLVALYREMERQQQQVLDRLPAALPPADGAPALRTLLRQLSLRSSARNQWPARVAALAGRGGLVDVRLALDAAEGAPQEAPLDTAVATITPESAAAMALAPGSEVLVLLKAPGVRIVRSAPRRAPGRNALRGAVEALRPGPQHTGVSLRLDGGQRLSAVVGSTEAGGLAPGMPAWGCFGGEQLVLVGFG